MSKQVIWTRAVLEAFIEEGNLNEQEEKIIRMHAKRNKSRQQIADENNVDVRTLDGIIHDLKRKYDAAQRTSSILQPRRLDKHERIL